MKYLSIEEIIMANENVIGKDVLAGLVAEKPGLSKKDAKATIDALMETVTESMKADKEIRFIGFGAFKKAHRDVRKGSNPSTGEEIEIEFDRDSQRIREKATFDRSHELPPKEWR